ncbi:arsenite methyltransferase [Oligoflexia bacterium]|nr:arsenite methyltransferase [Oligoflexia bacterium]
MADNEEIRKTVSEAYSKAVTESGAGCSSSGTIAPSQSGCCTAPEQKGTVVKLAGYGSDELRDLPPEAVVNSFGCGNPVAFSAVKEGDVVLDLGAGAGIDILLAAKKVGPTGRAIGIDMTDEMLAKAEENIKASGLTNVEVRRGIIEDLPVESASVDWVISNCVINLSPEKERVFKEIERVLKPGGQMLVSDIVVEELPEVLRASKALYSSCVAGAISEGAYIEGLTAAGLSGVEVRARIVYETSQLAAFFKSELSDLSRDLPVSDPEELLACSAKTLTGKVWSAKFYAKKVTQ